MEITPLSAGPVPLRARADAPGETAPDTAALEKAAQAFEASFLAEILKHSGLNAMPDAFGGGAGEDAFASFLTEEYARLLAARGGIGLAEQIFESLKTRGDTV